MTETNHGFKISEADLKLRGPGDFFGSRQHGLPELKIANLAADMEVLAKAQSAAQALMDNDPTLCQPENKALRQKIERLFELRNGTLN
jgi:ATP-dependent DNA helicase RecG